jgi:DNA-binding PadR family transcriptional regulator
MGVGFSKLEEFVLLAVARTAPDSFGVRVAEQVPTATMQGVYAVLARLESRGVLSSTELGPRGIRGGRRRKAYAITEHGQNELRRSMHDAEHVLNGAGAIVMKLAPTQAEGER